MIISNTTISPHSLKRSGVGATPLISTMKYEWYFNNVQNASANIITIPDTGTVGGLNISNPALSNKPTASSIGGKVSELYDGIDDYLYKSNTNFLKGMSTWMLTIVVKHITGANIYFSAYNETNANAEGWYIQYTAGGNLILVAHNSSGVYVIPINHSIALVNGTDYIFTFAYDGTNVKLYNQTTEIFTAVAANPIQRPTQTDNIAVSALIRPAFSNVFGKSNNGYIGADEFNLTRLNANVATLKSNFSI